MVEKKSHIRYFFHFLILWLLVFDYVGLHAAKNAYFYSKNDPINFCFFLNDFKLDLDYTALPTLFNLNNI